MTLQRAPMADSIQLDRLRAVVLRNPGLAVEHLRRLTTDPGGPAGVGDGRRTGDPLTIDLRILLAESSMRLAGPGAGPGDVATALDACREAAGAAAASEPVDWRRLTVALGVSADIAVWAALPNAVEACDGYVIAATNCDPPDERRIVFAGALRAVAVYHHIDCGEGRHFMATAQGLQQQLRRPDESTAAMFRTALSTMQEGCRYGRYRGPAGHPPSLPGGVLHPGLSAPSPDHLAHRIRTRPAVHSCRRMPRRPSAGA